MSGPFEIRHLAPGEAGQYIDWIAAGFYDEVSEELRGRIGRLVSPERDLVALDAGRVVGTAVSIPFVLTVPGGELPAVGVTGVTVHMTHRRRGILRLLMRRQLDEARERGEPLAVLWASEGGIYPRFGYGLASMNGRMQAERDRMVLRGGSGKGRARLLDAAEALELLPPLYEAVRRRSPGFYARSPEWWELKTLADAPESRHGGGPLFRALLELDGVPAGYALYRMAHTWTQGVPEGDLQVAEALAVSPAAYRELWRFLFGADLARTVSARHLAVDDPLPLLVTEPTRLRLSVGDGLYLRVVDLQAALSGRGYASTGSLVLRVSDAFCPWNEGTWELRVDDDGVSVEPSAGPADVALAIGDLASAYLGGFRFAELADAGHVEELSPGGVGRADALFRTPRAPWCPEGF